MDLNMTQDELRAAVIGGAVDKIVEQMFDDGSIRVDFEKLLHERVREAVDEAVSDIAGKAVAPLMLEKIDGIILQQTNQWGEATGKPMTFVEYLVDRAEKWMTEPVDHNGKTKSELKDRYDQGRFKAKDTRIVHAVDKHLRYRIQTAMERIMESANETLVEGIRGAIEAQLVVVRDKLKVVVKT